jgi:hypothetical protein
MITTEIRDARRRRPFRSFYLRAKDGRRYPVIEPEHVLVAKHLLVVVDPEKQIPTHVSPDDIEAIEYVDAPVMSNDNGH